MLTPEFLESFPQPIFNLFQDLEDEILADISRRIAKTGKITDTAQWQIDRLGAILSTDEKIKKAISNTDKQAQKEIEKMLNEAAQTSSMLKRLFIMLRINRLETSQTTTNWKC